MILFVYLDNTFWDNAEKETSTSRLETAPWGKIMKWVRKAMQIISSAYFNYSYDFGSTIIYRIIFHFFFYIKAHSKYLMLEMIYSRHDCNFVWYDYLTVNVPREWILTCFTRHMTLYTPFAPPSRKLRI